MDRETMTAYDELRAERYVELYPDTAGEWRWRRRVVLGGKIVADSGEGYTERNDAREAATRENPGMEIRDLA